MTKNVRFGRKTRLPSTMEIKRQLKLMVATDTLSEALKQDGRYSVEIQSLLETLIETYKLTPDRVNMILDRIRIERSTFAAR